MNGAASEVSEFELEHDYAKHPSLRVKPQTEQICRDRVVLLESKNLSADEDDLDIESVSEPTPLTYNKEKINYQINELKKQINQKVFGNESDELTEAEEKFWDTLDDLKKDLNPKKLDLLDRTMSLVLDLYTVFLSIKDQGTEALKRRSAIDRCARHMRRLFASVGYQNPNLQWLHQTLVDILPRYLCGPYLDVLCALRSKIPQLMNGSLEPILSQGDTRAARALGFTTRNGYESLITMVLIKCSRNWGNLT